MGHMAEMTEPTSEAELRELLGTPARRSATKVGPCCTPGIATGCRPAVLPDRDLRGGRPARRVPRVTRRNSFQVLDHTTIAIPDRAATGGSTVRRHPQQPQVSLLFLVPGRDDTLASRAGRLSARRRSSTTSSSAGTGRGWRCWSRWKRSSPTAPGVPARPALGSADLGPRNVVLGLGLNHEATSSDEETVEELEQDDGPGDRGLSTRQLNPGSAGTALFCEITRAVAMAAMPSPRPVRPRPSVVVPDRLTGTPPSASDSTFSASVARVGARTLPDDLNRDVADLVSGPGDQGRGRRSKSVPAAPAHLRSAVPKLAPRSPSPAADSSASQAACAATSPSAGPSGRAHLARANRPGRAGGQDRTGGRPCPLTGAALHSAPPVQGQEARISSSSASALSSLVLSARASSLTRICRALASMRFSPA